MKKRILETKLAEGQAALFYLGQVGFLIKYDETYILIDGYLSDYVDQNFSTEEVVWKRKYPAPIASEELDFVDHVFCSHAHSDHTDPWTLSKIAKVNPKARYYGTHAVVQAFREIGLPETSIEELRIDETKTLTKTIQVTAIPAAHEELHPDGQGGYEEAGFVLRMGDLTIYHAGDCCLYDGLEERVNGCDAMLLPINGRDYYRRYKKDIIGNFDSVEAVTLAKHTGARLLIPMHFDLYDVNEVNPAYFVDCLTRLNPTQAYHIFVPGEKYILS